jgi:hypothetical protein
VIDQRRGAIPEFGGCCLSPEILSVLKERGNSPEIRHLIINSMTPLILQPKQYKMMFRTHQANERLCVGEWLDT